MNYTAVVVITMVAPNGKVLGTKHENVTLAVDHTEFASEAEAEEHMTGELSEIVAAATHSIENCFN